MKEKGSIYYVSVWLISSALFSSVQAAEHIAYKSNYIGQEKRIIKSLSADDISQLKQGKGWGLAKAAELNGVPGPAHVLQMKKKISLTQAQEKKIQALFDDMESKPIPLGKKLIELEKRLNQNFSNHTINKKSLMTQLEQIAVIRKDLRFTHLVTHLQTLDILKPEQVTLYNKLRGYSSGSPCDNIPEGHDAEMWRKHNGCK